MKNTIINIINAKQEADFIITLFFSDATQQTIDFEPFIKSLRGFYAFYQHPEMFAKWQLDDSSIHWGENYDLFFPFENLYNNTIVPMSNNINSSLVKPK